ncbi:DUF2975 domain-containing protein [Corynebacterium tuscaniense]|uniref:DUF2975 domain-containing protein n=1 Tax=Corynebacterium tuscaniense TaxID=302449 RepID=UPI000690E6E6|nr:DUF2975 domain-containing protein [Corynebacterium tuscaniense]
MNTSTPTPNPEPRPPKGRDRTDISRFDAVAVAIALVWLLPEIIALATDGTISSRLSPAIEGGLHFADLSSGPQTMFAVALGLKFFSLLCAVFLVTNSFTDMAKEQVFTEKNARRLNAAGISIAVFFVARLGLEGMANNWAAAQLGVDWWGDPGTGTPLSELAPALLLIFVLSALARILRRGAKLEEDVDGLV